MSADLEGRLDVRLSRRDGRITAVAIRSTRPQLARRLMAGRTPTEAADLAGMIFSLCGQAQRAAAHAACNAAAGAAAEAADEMPIRMELAREHAWRLLLDWPQETGKPPDMASLMALRQALPEAFAATLEGLLHDKLLGEPPDTWLQRDLDGLGRWCRQGDTLPARLLGQGGEGPDVGISRTPLLPALADWHAGMVDTLAGRAFAEPDFCAMPDWHGQPAETGALARTHAHPLLAAWLARRGRGMRARMLARLLELAALPRLLRHGGPPSLRAWSIGEGVGVAGVETSRGLLFHMARLADGKVADYRILAPTEWNFHPAGPLAQALTGLQGDTGLDALARLVARSLDPCVGFAVESGDA